MNYNEETINILTSAQIELGLVAQFQERLHEAGIKWDPATASWHGYPTQFYADLDGEKLSFRLRSNRATLVRGSQHITVIVPDGTMAEEAFFALLLQSERVLTQVG